MLGRVYLLVKSVGYRWMLLGDVGMVWPPYPTKSRSCKRNGISPSHFESILLGRGKIRVRFVKGENQKSNENH